MGSKPLHPYQFGSDNYSGVWPEVLAALAEANRGHVPAYGDDPWTEKAKKLLQETFETDAVIHFVFGSTAANALTLAAMCAPYNSVICDRYAHIQVDECGAPEFFTGGAKLHLVDGTSGKVAPQQVREAALARVDEHASKPRVLSLTQATEMGTVYTVEETRALAQVARELNLLVHMDGARFANAAAALGARPAEMTWKAGVDVLCLGGTKNGLMLGEVILFFNRALAEHFEWRRKQTGQLVSKMRYVAAQWIAALENKAWLKHAGHANAMAAYLEEKLLAAGLQAVHPRQANAVFVEISAKTYSALEEKGWRFYDGIGPKGYRLMCSWDTQRAHVDELVADIKKAGGAA
jgi:threonine aldolase